ncbi:hypothetical protein AeMF1_009762, partial [Aphanomyces euteiches]
RLTSLVPIFLAAPLASAANSFWWVNITGFRFNPTDDATTHLTATSVNDCLTKATSSFANFNNATNACDVIHSSGSLTADESSTAHAKYDPRVLVCYGNQEFNGTVVESRQETLGFNECMAKSTSKLNVLSWRGEVSSNCGATVGTCELKAMTSVSKVGRRGVISCKRLF